MNNTTDLQAKLTAQTAKIKERFDSLGVAYSGVQQSGGLVSTPPSGGWGANPSGAGGSYFYHPDHLGSSSLITNVSGDRYRTGAGQITLGPIKIGYNMFTGDPGLNKKDRNIDPDQGGKGGLYLTGKNGENPDEFRAGVSYIGIGPFRFGKDSEKTRHELQNVLIHDKLLASNPSPWFRQMLDRPDKWYWGYFGGGMLW